MSQISRPIHGNVNINGLVLGRIVLFGHIVFNVVIWLRQPRYPMLVDNRGCFMIGLISLVGGLGYPCTKDYDLGLDMVALTHIRPCAAVSNHVALMGGLDIGGLSALYE